MTSTPGATKRKASPLLLTHSDKKKTRPVHSTPRRTGGRVLFPIASPVNNFQELIGSPVEKCKEFEEGTSVSINTSLDCNRTHDGVSLCTGCGKSTFELSFVSDISLHSHGDLEQGYVCPKCGAVNEVKDPGDKELKDEEESMRKLLNNCSKICAENGKTNIVLKLMEVICNGKLDLDSLTFEIFLDTINAISSESLTEVRFSQKSKLFWKFFIDKFGGAPIRALSGWKMIGSILSGQSKPGYLSGKESDMILAIPSEDVLKSFDPYGGNWPRHIPPGISTEIVERVKEKHHQTSVCLAFDGKKLAPGLKDDKGDVNLLGHEPNGESVEKLQENHRSDLLCLKKLTEYDDFSTNLTNASTVLSKKKMELDGVIKKKLYSLEKLKKQGGENYTKSRYAYAISMLTALLLELRDLNKRNGDLREKIMKLGSTLNLYDIWPCQNSMPLRNCTTYVFLPDDENDEGYLKQGSDEWFQARKLASATGSKLFDATGCAGLKRQKEYFWERNGKEQAPFPDHAVTAMEHGRRHEACAMATFCYKVLPVFFPGHIVKEVGGISFSTEKLSLIISPDGVLKDKTTHVPVAAVEIKCPYSGILSTEIPERYYLQVQAEMVALHVKNCIFITWTEETSRVMQVSYDEEVWNMALDILSLTFGADIKACPSKLTPSVKALKYHIKSGVKVHCKLLCEVKSLHACESNIEHQPSSQRFKNSSPNLDELSLHEQMNEICEESLLITRKQFQATRHKATEVVTFVAGDLDRMWSKDQVHGLPIGYFLRGYSLPICVVGNILEEFLQYCYRQGLHIPVSCFDGQFMKLVQTWNGHPQTKLELQKQFWLTVCKLPKAKIIATFKTCNEADKTVLDNPTSSRLDAWKAIAHSYSDNLPKTATRYLNSKEICDKKKKGTSEPKENLDIAQDLEDIPLDLLSINDQLQDLQELTSHHIDENHDNQPASVPDLPTNEPEAEPRLVLLLEDFKELKDEFTRNFDKWGSKSVEDLKCYFVNCHEMAKMNSKELASMLKFFRDRKLLKVKISGSKQTLLRELKSLLHICGYVPSAKFRRRTPAKLKCLSLRCLQQKSYPKMALNVSYANWKFGEMLDIWRQGAKIKHNMEIQGLSKPVEWFYIPEWHSERNQLETKKIDPHHLLTRHRSALCKGNLGPAMRSDFTRVAERGNTQLKLGMIEDCINMQSTDFSLITFSEEVENELRAMKANKSAEMCKMIRDWFEACDQPGIQALERCRNMWRYREKLLSFVNLQRFPPPGMHIRGYPKQLWEATIASIDVDLQLYSLTKRRTYNQRAVSSQNCEAIYSSLAALPGSNNGVPTCIGLETNMAKLCGESLVRLDPDRGFPLRMSSAPVYPQQTLDRLMQPLPCATPPPTYIDEIHIVDHPFDDRSRRRTARHNLHGLSNIHEPAKGVSGVRQHHKVDESRINPLVRMGKAKDTNL